METTTRTDSDRAQLRRSFDELVFDAKRARAAAVADREAQARKVAALEREHSRLRSALYRNPETCHAALERLEQADAPTAALTDWATSLRTQDTPPFPDAAVIAPYLLKSPDFIAYLSDGLDRASAPTPTICSSIAARRPSSRS
jgi:hypothetical protein